MQTEKAYTEGLLGTKIGMTQIFTETGSCIPVTALKLGPCTVLDVIEEDKHGYSAVRMGYKEQKQQRVSKPAAGNFKKAGKGAFRHVQEVRCNVAELGWNEVGKEIVAGDVFSSGDFVDVSGTTIGRGFSGVVRRYKVRGQPATRGTHEKRRNIGSIGMCKNPGRVFKNMKMPGQMGNKRKTVLNLKVVAVNTDENVIFVKGAVPGPKNGVIFVRKAIKKILKQAA